MICKYHKLDKYQKPKGKYIAKAEERFDTCLHVKIVDMPTKFLRNKLRKKYGEPMVRLVTTVGGTKFSTWKSTEVWNDDAEWYLFDKFLYFNDPSIGVEISLRGNKMK